MKRLARYHPMMVVLAVLTVLAALLLTGCTSVPSTKKDPNFVSKSQYDELLKKNEELILRYERLKDQLKDHIKLNMELSEKISSPTDKGFSNLFDFVVGSLNDLKALVENESYSEAIGMARSLSASPFPQIAVRAKFYLGEVLFRQKNYDLAMQVFEEIVNQSAFSGVVIKAVERLVICSENLKLNLKREQYYSLLHDFFETT